MQSSIEPFNPKHDEFIVKIVVGRISTTPTSFKWPSKWFKILLLPSLPRLMHA
jgi:hypothetical protein